MTWPKVTLQGTRLGTIFIDFGVEFDDILDGFLRFSTFFLKVRKDIGIVFLTTLHRHFPHFTRQRQTDRSAAKTIPLQ